MDSTENSLFSIEYHHLGNLLDDMASIQGISDQYVFLSTSQYVNNILRIGGWLSRSASLPFLGRPLVIRGLRQAFPALCSLVGLEFKQQEEVQQ